MATSRNPVLNADTFRPAGIATDPRLDGGSGLPDPFTTAQRSDTMTIRGVISKSAILLLLVAASFSFAWDRTLTSDGGSLPLLFGASILGFVLSLVISFKPTMAPFLAPVFALAQGLALGAVSALYEYQATYSNGVPSGYDGIVFQAAVATMAVFGAMLFLFRTGLITVTDRMRSVVKTAMLGIVGVYLLSFVLSLFGTTVPMIHEGGAVGIGFSLLVLGVASFMLLVDFDAIQQGVAAGAPRYMEWYSAFALLVTLVWIYMEMLRLLSKMRR